VINVTLRQRLIRRQQSDAITHPFLSGFVDFAPDRAW
jgi:hypothetical protein